MYIGFNDKPPKKSVVPDDKETLMSKLPEVFSAYEVAEAFGISVNYARNRVLKMKNRKIITYHHKDDTKRVLYYQFTR